MSISTNKIAQIKIAGVLNKKESMGRKKMNGD
jgi:hypothetical protein